MSSLKSFALWMGLITCGILPLGACTNTPWAANLERSLAADPKLKQSPELFGESPVPIVSLEAGSSSSVAQLPAGFPGEIPRYPNATLVAVTQPASSELAQPIQTRWTTADSSAQVRQFYQDKLKADGWQLSQSGGAANTGIANSGASDSGAIVASRDNLRVIVSTSPVATPNATGTDATGTSSAAATPGTAATPKTTGKTEFTLSYQLDGAGSSNPTAHSANIPQPGDADFVGPVWPSYLSSNAQTNTAQSGANPSGTPQSGANQSGTQSNTGRSPVAPAANYTDLSQAPAELQKYIVDLSKLGALPLRSPASGTSAFKPNQTITRREYARWLVTANNQIYANQPSRQVRLGTASDRPAFPDVPTTDPDFGVIQGLANAGLITSALSGDGSPVSFRPDASLTREDLILWKVPVDIRRSLPNANLDTLQQTWGFQDAAKIDPKAQRAVIADYQNGDQANIRRAFGYTTLFQPKKTVTRAEAAAALWYFGSQGEGLSAKDALALKDPSPTSSPEKPIGG